MADIQTILFGSAVAVLPTDLYLIIGCVTVALTLQIFGWRGFVEMLYDPSTAQVRGLPLSVLRWFLVGSLALLVAIITRTLGALPTFAMTILPAIAAIKWAPNIPRAMLMAGVFGGIMGSLGYFVAFKYGFPVGASQTLTGILIVLLATILKTIKVQLTRETIRQSNIVKPARPHQHGHGHGGHCHHHSSKTPHQGEG